MVSASTQLDAALRKVSTELKEDSALTTFAKPIDMALELLAQADSLVRWEEYSAADDKQDEACSLLTQLLTQLPAASAPGVLHETHALLAAAIEKLSTSGGTLHGPTGAEAEEAGAQEAAQLLQALEANFSQRPPAPAEPAAQEEASGDGDAS